MNPFDWKVAEGRSAGSSSTPSRCRDGLRRRRCRRAGRRRGRQFRLGDRVYGQFMKVALGRGSYAELAVAPADGKLALIPDDLSFEVAAALPTASVTAYQAIAELGLDAGRTVLVNGASGGVGQSAVQFAATVGARVVATGPSRPGRPPARASALPRSSTSPGGRPTSRSRRPPRRHRRRRARPGQHRRARRTHSSTPVRPGGVAISTNGALDPDGAGRPRAAWGELLQQRDS